MPDAHNAVPAEHLRSVPNNFRRGARPTWHQRRRHRAVLALLTGLTGRVLDYGCGYGDVTDAIARSHDVVGCDTDPVRVAFARREFSPVRFEECSPGGAPFEDGSFDVVVSTVVIHFVPDPAAYLREVRRLLRAGGNLLIVCQNEPVVRNAVRKGLGRGRSPTPLWVPPLSEVRELLRAEGFEVVGSTYFYDPPVVGWRTVGDWAFGCVEQFLSLVRVRWAAQYHAYLTRRTGPCS